MTTIAYDGRYLAADTLTVRGGNRSEQPLCKIAVQDGYAFAFGGMWGHFRQQLMAWALAAFWDADAPKWRFCPAKDVEGALLVVTPMRGLLVFTDQAPYPDPEAWPFAIGTGGDIALGAMGAGVTAMEAVKLAMRWDLKTGGEVDFIDVKWLDKGVQRWDGVMPSAKFPMPVGVPLEDEPANDTAKSQTFKVTGNGMTARRVPDLNEASLVEALVEIRREHPNGKIRAKATGICVCEHSYIPSTCETCRANRTANLYPV